MDKKSDDPARRIGELEDKLKQRDARIEELKSEIDEQRVLVEELREHAVDYSETMERWKESFGMVLKDNGKWGWAEWIESTDQTEEAYNELVRDFNKLVDRFNAVVAPRNPGRPIAASEEQRRQVQDLHHLIPRSSLREIAKETGLGLRTIRTIIGKEAGTDRTSVKQNKLRRRELNRAKQATWRARKRTRDTLPERVEAVLKKGIELVKKAGVSRVR